MADLYNKLRDAPVRLAPTRLEEAMSAMPNRTPDQLTVQATEGDNALARGLRAGVYGLGSTANALVATAAEQQGLTAFAQERFNEADHFAQMADATGPAVRDFRRIKSISDASNFVLGSMGQALGSTAPALALGAAGALKFGLRGAGPGAALGAFVPEAGEQALALRNDPVTAALPADDRLQNAATKGAVNAALESVTPAGAIRRVVQGGAAKTLGRDLARGAAIEGGTEGAQTAVGQAFHNQLNPEKGFDAGEIANAAVQGTIGGAGFAGATRIPAVLQDSARAVPTTISDLRQRLRAPEAPLDPDGAPDIPVSVNDVGTIADMLKDYDERVGKSLNDFVSSNKDDPILGKFTDLRDPDVQRQVFSEARKRYEESGVGRRFKNAVDDVTDYVKNLKTPGDGQRSTVRTRIDEEIHDSLVESLTPEERAALKPTELLQLSSGLRQVVERGQEVPDSVIDMLGDRTEKVISATTSALNKGGVKPTLSMDAVKARRERTKTITPKVEDVVRGSLRPELFADKPLRDEAAKILTPRLIDYINRGARDEKAFVEDLETAFEDPESVLEQLKQFKAEVTSARAFEGDARQAPALAEERDEDTLFFGDGLQTKEPFADERIGKVYSPAQATSVIEQLQQEYGRNVDFRTVTQRDSRVKITARDAVAEDAGFNKAGWRAIRENPKHNKSGLENGILTVNRAGEGNGTQSKVNLHNLVKEMERAHGESTGSTGATRVGELLSRGISQLLSDPTVAAGRPFDNATTVDTKTGQIGFNFPDNTPVAYDAKGNVRYTWGQVKEGVRVEAKNKQLDYVREFADELRKRNPEVQKLYDAGKKGSALAKKQYKAKVREALEERETRKTLGADDREGVVDLNEVRQEKDETLFDVSTRLGAIPNALLRASRAKLGSKPMSDEDKAAIREYVTKVLGKDAKVLFAKMTDAGSFAKISGEEVLKISISAINPQSVARHEAFHAFMSRLVEADSKAANDLLAAASATPVVSRLRKLLADEPEALKQLDDPHERLAYAYQFWSAGALTVGPRTKTWFEKIGDFFGKIFGMLSEVQDTQKLDDIFAAFHEGRFSERDTVAEVMREVRPKTPEQRAEELLGPVSGFMKKLFFTADGYLRAWNNAYVNDIVDKFHSPIAGDGKTPGYLQAKHAELNKRLNRLAGMLEGTDLPTQRRVLEALQRGQNSGHALQERIRTELEAMHAYMTEAGVRGPDGEKLGYVKSYFPRVYDPEVIGKNRDKFIEMLVRNGVPAESAAQMATKLSLPPEATDPKESDFHSGLTYFAPQTNKRRLVDIPSDEIAPFLNKDLFETLATYTARATRRAEYARRFGDQGEKINEAVDKSGLSDKQKIEFRRAVSAMEGTIGRDIPEPMRKVFSGVMAYQNVRLLPLALFSSLVDPLGIAVRGGDMRDAYQAFKRGITGLVKTNKDDAFQLAALIGAIETDTSIQLARDSFGSQYMTGWSKRLNDTLFKYNGMESWNRSMRVAAVAAGEKFLIRHATSPNEHSERFLAELGIKASDVQVMNDRLVLNPKVADALNLWVDGAVLRPNAAIRPVWMSDPHWMLVSHLKQFMYSFQKTILARVSHEASNGNYKPLMALASYVPAIIAADMLRILVTPTGADDKFREDWELGDWLWNGVKRAGLFGPSQFALDAQGDLARTKLGIESAAGPTVEQLLQFGHAASGAGSLDSWFKRALPGYQYIR